ncbi:MAG TPA: alpha/beta fold hydrolase [Thermoanaerobaculia bacterium]
MLCDADDVPALPPFLAAQLPCRRRLYRLERGADAGRRLHFLDEGPPDAPPVLLQHGNPTWSFLWRKVIAELGGGLRCVAPDLLGFGLSDRLPRLADHSLERHADAVAELVEALGLERVILVGQDWGGPVVTGVGARLPGRVAGLVLANTSVVLPRRPRGTLFHRLSRLPVVSDLAYRVLGFPQAILHRVQGDPASIRGDVARAYRWPLRRWRDRVAPLALARMVPGSPDHPSVPELGRGEAWARGFQGPTALVWGMRDPILARALRRHEEAFPRATVRRTEAGHFLQEEVPEVIAEAVREVASSQGPWRAVPGRAGRRFRPR